MSKRTFSQFSPDEELQGSIERVSTPELVEQLIEESKKQEEDQKKSRMFEITNDELLYALYKSIVEIVQDRTTGITLTEIKYESRRLQVNLSNKKRNQYVGLLLREKYLERKLINQKMKYFIAK